MSDKEYGNGDLSEQIRLALAANEDDIFAALCHANSSTLGAVPSSKDALAGRGKQWFADRVPDIKRLVCQNTFMQQVVKRRDEDDNVTIVLMVLDILVASYGKVSGLFIAVIVVRKGLRSFCEMPIASSK